MSKPLSLRPDYPGYSGGAAVPRGDDSKDTMIARVAASYLNQNPANVLDGMVDYRVTSLITRICDQHTQDGHGIFTDQHWAPVQTILKELKQKNIRMVPTGGQNIKNEMGRLEFKSWEYEIPFLDFRGKPDHVYLIIYLFSEGPDEDPLSKYKVLAFATSKENMDFNDIATFRSASDERSPPTKRATMTNVLDGMRKSKVVTVVNHLIDPHTKGFFRDEFWTPIAAIRKELDRNGIEYTALPGTGTYSHNQEGKPISKSWKYEIEFVNDRGNLDAVYLHITASGAGSVADPMSVYDVVAYAN